MLSFIEAAEKVHGDRYIYDRAILEYQTRKIKVPIGCRVHVYFYQAPQKHLIGQGCPLCAKASGKSKVKLTIDEFIAKAVAVHGDKYDYSESVYKGGKVELKIICRIHLTSFFQTPSNHIYGACGCPTCGLALLGGSQLLTKDEFIQNARNVHGDLYDYGEVIYENNHSKVKIRCIKHGLFDQTPINHIYNNAGCPLCSEKTERKLFEYLKDAGYNVSHQFSPDWCINPETGYQLRFDFLIRLTEGQTDHNIIVEMDGEQHFKQVSNWKSPEVQRKYDVFKMHRAIDNGLSGIRILQTDVANNTNNWKKFLFDNIKQFDEPGWIFHDVDGIYNNHDTDLWDSLTL